VRRENTCGGRVSHPPAAGPLVGGSSWRLLFPHIRWKIPHRGRLSDLAPAKHLKLSVRSHGVPTGHGMKPPGEAYLSLRYYLNLPIRSTENGSEKESEATSQ
jgi:hypothetical protein